MKGHVRAGTQLIPSLGHFTLCTLAVVLKVRQSILRLTGTLSGVLGGQRWISHLIFLFH